ncbi:MAG: hypothetical protein F4213_03375 [Boseongicola sp. SB0677_bin_26]|nr:hypothetical protein [Boseongicola sp. SB0665_bin_10]MYG25056.1 hypothetical protein [Boseongicola sp. SB0677_bin_26]
MRNIAGIAGRNLRRAAALVAVLALALAASVADAAFILQGLSGHAGPPNCADPYTRSCGRPHPVPHVPEGDGSSGEESMSVTPGVLTEEAGQLGRKKGEPDEEQ